MFFLLGLSSVPGFDSAIQDRDLIKAAIFLGGVGLFLVAIYIIQWIRDAEPHADAEPQRKHNGEPGDCNSGGSHGYLAWFGDSGSHHSEYGGSDCGVGDCGGDCGGD